MGQIYSFRFTSASRSSQRTVISSNNFSGGKFNTDICAVQSKNILMKKSALFLLLSLLLAFTAQAQLTVKAEYIGQSAYRDDDTDKKISNYKGSSVIYQADLNIPLSVKMNPDG